jgi:ribose/xylose/arabinose/galactoside ABC-type transport system permease subunit
MSQSPYEPNQGSPPPEGGEYKPEGQYTPAGTYGPEGRYAPEGQYASPGQYPSDPSYGEDTGRTTELSSSQPGEPYHRGFFEPDTPERGTLLIDGEPSPPAQPPAPPFAPAATSPPSAPIGRDRLWIHLLWEFVLFTAVIGVGVAMRINVGSAVFSTAGRDNLVIRTAITLLIATGLAFSLRAAVPNLAVGTIAVGAGTLTGWLVDRQGYAIGTALGTAALVTLAVGLVLAILVVGFHTPAWAASLGAAVLISGAAIGLSDGQALIFRDAPNVASWRWLWLAVAAVISVGGGLMWAIPGIRRSLGGTRSERDPGRRPGAAAGFGATLALVVSTLLAGSGGTLQALYTRAALPTSADTMTAVALGAVLLGGVSAFGRRGGIFGTLLGVILLVFVQTWLTLKGTPTWTLFMPAGVAILLGLVVNRGLEASGRRRPRPAPVADPGQPGQGVP